MADQIDKVDVSDETLIERIASDRDKSAFTALYERYAGRIKGMVMKSGAFSSPRALMSSQSCSSHP